MRGAIHVLTIQHLGPGTPDEEGHAQPAVLSETTVRGRLIQYMRVSGGKDSKVIGKFAADYQTVAVLPSGTAIMPSDRVVASGISAHLDATYEVVQIIEAPAVLEAWLRLTGVEQ